MRFDGEKEPKARGRIEPRPVSARSHAGTRTLGPCRGRLGDGARPGLAEARWCLGEREAGQRLRLRHGSGTRLGVRPRAHLAQTIGATRVLRRRLQCGALAVAPRVRANDPARRSPVVQLPQRQSRVRGYHVLDQWNQRPDLDPGLPPDAGSRHGASQAPQGPDRMVLPHPMASTGHVRHPPLARGDPRRPARGRYPRLPPS